MDELTDQQIDAIVHSAWQDRTSFEEIRERTGLCEAESVCSAANPSREVFSWRKRANGRITNTASA